ncbi:hypothetical protein CKM354_000049000 [Cercospora kikuchii]|uniref:Apple domain-containing protein n=1 Tax=Cercospora kikuchii TaxID=84275 RepID=A0A9P3C924_9PEZI|nr:uncharacterized protein CKM354_000049000 [Cercospora kikuchii]GIZ37027.1 hypothetical protein CKM354_000049000 [Cercospora kikuchii]
MPALAVERLDSQPSLAKSNNGQGVDTWLGPDSINIFEIMQFLELGLLIGAASANPLGQLFERQANAACTATYLASCTGAASTSARAWCTNQGYNRLTQTRTNVNWRTVQSTITTYTSTSTFSAPTSTRTVSSVRTSIITTTTTSTTTFDSTTTVPVTGAITGCPVYIPPQPVAPEVEPPVEEPTPQEPVPEEPTFWEPQAKPAACVEQSRNVYTDSNGQAYEYIRCPGHGDSSIGINRYANVSVSSFDECAKYCRYEDRCAGFNWATNNPGTCNVAIGGVGRLQTFNVAVAPWYYHHLVKRTDPVAALPAQCTDTQEDHYVDVDGVRRTYKSCWGHADATISNDYPIRYNPPVDTPTVESCAAQCRQTKKCAGFNWLGGNNCNIVVGRPGRWQPFQPGQWRYYHFTGETMVAPAANNGTMAKRQASGTLPKPTCVRATNAAQTSSACRCAIPTPTTTTAVVQATSTRTVTITSRLISTTTVTPTAVTTQIRTTTLTRQRKIVSTETVMHTTESTVTRTLASIPTGFYIADNYDEESRHFVEWPADSDEIFYHVQYDFNSADDEWAPTVFKLDGETLSVADLDDQEGSLENYVVVGKNHDADGMQTGNPTDGIHIVATQGGGGNDAVNCKIEATENDQCALMCTSGSYSVNSRDGDGTWSLMSEATEYQFTNYVFAANVALEEKRSEFRKREMELRRAATKAKML